MFGRDNETTSVKIRFKIRSHIMSTRQRNIIFLLLLILPFSLSAQIYKVPIGTSGNSYLLSVKNCKNYTIKK